MIEKIKTGVIGVGSMGQNHARIYNEISQLVAVADPNEKQGREVAKRFGVVWYSDYRDMLDTVDAVSIAVPTANHLSVSKAVVRAGVHLLVEKPLAGNVSDATEIVESANNAGLTLAVGHVERHNPVVSYVKDAIKKGFWGEIITMSSKRVSRYPQRIKDVGVIMDLAVHDMDIMCYLTGKEVKEMLSMKGHRENQEYEDHALVVLDFENLTKGICEVNWLTPVKIRELSLTCTGAFVRIDFINQLLEVSQSRFTKPNEENLYLSEQKLETNVIKVPKGEPLKRELIDFLECTITNKSPLVNGIDGIRVVDLACRAQKT